MIRSWFSVRYPFWITVVMLVGNASVLYESLFAQQTPSPSRSTAKSPTVSPVSQSPQATLGQTSSSEIRNNEAKVPPSVILLTAFELKGKLFTVGNGFFFSA